MDWGPRWKVYTWVHRVLAFNNFNIFYIYSASLRNYYRKYRQEGGDWVTWGQTWGLGERRAMAI